MNKQEFHLLVRSGAVVAADLMKRGKVWTVWVGVGPTREDASGEPITATKGQVREWADMVRAYEFIRAAGFKGRVEVDELDQEPAGWTVTVAPTETGQWRWGVLDPEGVEVVGGGGCETEDEAQEAGEAELAAQTGAVGVVV